jgi:sulfonate transport system permease protein
MARSQLVASSSAAARWRERLLPAALPLTILVVWELASSIGWMSSRVLPEPLAVVRAFWHLSVTGEMWQHVATSSWRALSGFAIGGSLALALGLLTGSLRGAETLLDSTLQICATFRRWRLSHW